MTKGKKYRSTVNLIMKNTRVEKHDEIPSELLKNKAFKDKLLAHNQIEEVPDEPAETEDENPGAFTKTELRKFSKSDLVNIAQNYFEPEGMNKDEIIAKLVNEELTEDDITEDDEE